ncbi:M56 family metallopeptidase [Tahibacter soli]|uniref:M56 family metallopeptidase n=1 Tax=Tahibacter soli TaxID=2983605 RepID=A0A9X3YLY5_9GAMM|nr:M56 family metallopeptidase [Tahibacter soli]MDC8014677.1 M56 family metallopeptidase [Tahibacter soli]
MQSLIDAALSLAFHHLLVSALLFAAALLLSRVSALGAEWRSWLLLAIFLTAALSPLAIFVPGASTLAPAIASSAPALEPLPGEGATVDEAVYDAGYRRDMVHLDVPRSPWTLVVLTWSVGILVQLTRLFDGWALARRLRRRAHPAPALEAELADVLPRRARIATTATDGPMVVGLLHPCILIPRAVADGLEAGILRDVLRHEIAHIRRGDLWLAALVRLALAVFWWSPFLRLIERRLELAREMACDERAAHASGVRVGYAASLLTMAETLPVADAQAMPLAAGIFARRSQLARRIDGLLDDETEVSPQRRRAAVALCSGLLVAFAGVAVATSPSVDFSAWTTPATDTQAAALLAAARSGDDEALRRLVRDGADVDARVLDEGTAMIQAIRAGRSGTVDTLLDLGADPNRASLGEGNPLIVAAQLGHDAIVERLIRAGADVDRVVTYDETPLINAAREGHLSTVRRLVAHGADVNLGVVADGWLGRWRSPLNQARDPAVRAWLAAHGAVAGRP